MKSHDLKVQYLSHTVVTIFFCTWYILYTSELQSFNLYRFFKCIFFYNIKTCTCYKPLKCVQIIEFLIINVFDLFFHLFNKVKLRKKEENFIWKNKLKKSLLLVRLLGKGHGDTIQISLTILGDLTATIKKETFQYLDNFKPLI